MGSSTSTAAISTIQIPVTLLSMLGLDDAGLLYPKQSTPENNSFVDYIIVGGGTAGSVVGTRLAEDENNSVLILENGSDPPLTALAAGLFVTLPKSIYDYDHMSTFDSCAANSQGNRTTLTAGNMLGGSASLNHFIWTRGCCSDFDKWADITGEKSWACDNFFKYFIKSERLVDDEINSEYPEYHGTDGPTGISRQPSKRVLNYLKSFDEVGHPTVLDLNSNTNIGYSQAQFMLADKIRQTPAYSYLKMVKDNSNLQVSKNTHVTKIIFEDKVAVAVEAIYKGETYIFRARKEIILSAGVFNSPQILMLSGVGPEDHLKEMGIDGVAYLPVGDNYTDQVATTVVYKTKPALLPLGATRLNPDVTQIPFPVIVGNAALDRSATCPTYQVFGLLLADDTPLLTLACHNTFWYRNDICDSWQKQATGSDTLYLFLTNLVPKSRGKIRLNSTNPFDEPLIKTNFLTECEDLENMVKFVKDLTQVSKSSYFQDVGAKLIGLDLPECANEEIFSDEFWMCYIKNRAVSPYHFTGTCAMGGVVDGFLRVKGLKNLRVVDGSVIPGTASGAPAAAIIALAEKAADMIKTGQ